jgi:NAD(P)-dependent dehydrogenase (short-subunit alcohol dehydrogenase family)
MKTSLEGAVVLVTGSARRVGRAIALEFARQGANVVIHHHNSPGDAQSAAEEARSLGVQALVVQANQADPGEVHAMFGVVQAHFERLDVLVNSAASFRKANFLDIGFEEWSSVIGTNLTGPFLCTQAAARIMVSAGRGGAIINISDNSGLQPWKPRPHHSVAKAGVVQLTLVSALALAEHNIRVNCVVPGPVLRPAGEPEGALEAIASGLPLGRLGTPEDIARACLFLATTDFATGTVMRVDGGEGLVGGET